MRYLQIGRLSRVIAGKSGAVLMAMLLGACASGNGVNGSDNSGFLRDYSVLTESTSAQGTPVRGWASPDFTPANYDAILLDPLVLYPEPRPTDQVSAETLKQIITYSYDAFRQSLGQRFKLVDHAGPGVARIRVAFTGVATQDVGLRPYQFVPLAFVATMTTRAVAGTPQRAFIIVETEASDSVSGALLGQRIGVGTGSRLAAIAGQKVITLETVRPLLDELAAVAYPNLSQFVRTK